MALPERANEDRRLRLGQFAAAALGGAVGGLVGGSAVSEVLKFATRPDVRRTLEHIDKRSMPPLPDFPRLEGTHKVLVVPMKDPGDPEPQADYVTYGYDETTDTSTREYGLEGFLQDVNRFYRRNSQGNFQFDFTLLPWQDLLASTPVKLTSSESIARAGNEFIARAGLNEADYKTILYITPGKGIVGGGVAALGGKHGRAFAYIDYDDVTGDLLNFYYYQGLLAHELGHRIGLTHDHGQVLPDIQTEEYGPGSIMGTEDYPRHPKTGVVAVSYLSDLSIPDLLKLGWIDRERILDVTESGEYEIALLNSQDGPIALRLQKADEDRRYYISAEHTNTILQLREAGHDLEAVYDIWDERFRSSASGLMLREGQHKVVDRNNGITFEELYVNPATGMLRVRITFK